MLTGCVNVVDTWATAFLEIAESGFRGCSRSTRVSVRIRRRRSEGCCALAEIVVPDEFADHRPVTSEVAGSSPACSRH